MRRKVLLVVLALGSLAGFAAGAQAIRAHREGGWAYGYHGYPARWDRVAEACVRAAERVRAEGAAPSAPVP